MLLFSDMLYMLGRYASPSGPMRWRPCRVVVFACFIVTLTCAVVSVMLVVFSLSVFLSMCLVCFMFDCVGELFVECVCYLCG